MDTSEEFRWLLHKYLVLVSQLRLASKDFGDLSGLPNEHIAAALVVQDATTELSVLHDKLHEWHARLIKIPPRPAAAPSPAPAPPRSPRVSLVLKAYALDRKISVMRVLRKVPGYSLTRAKALVERELPAPIADGLAADEAAVFIQRLEAVGAVCRIATMSTLPSGPTAPFQ
jgi:ribosomal protein L7/L12